MHSRPPAWKTVLYSALPVTILFFACELITRLLGLGVTYESDRTIWPEESEYVKTYLVSPDGRKSLYRDGAIVLGTNVRLNELGFRDWLYKKENPTGSIRIAAIGDSFTFGYGLPREDTWTERLSVSLKESQNGDQSIQVMNFGLPGGNTTDELQVLIEHAWKFNPDIVILGYTLRNDARTRSQGMEIVRRNREQSQSTTSSLVRTVYENSHFVHYVGFRAMRWRRRQLLIDAIERQYEPTAPGFLESMESLRKFIGRCLERRIDLVVTIFPALHRDTKLNDFTNYDFSHIHRRIRDEVEAFDGVTFIDLVSELDDLNGEVLWLPGDGHPNSLYAKRIAEILYPVVHDRVRRHVMP